MQITDILKLPVERFSPRRNTVRIVVHCSATTPKQDIGSETIHTWHTRDRGFAAIGYHFVIRRDGTIEQGRPINAIGAHVQGHNASSLGICLVGGLDANLKPQDNFTAHQYDSLCELLAFLQTHYPNTTVLGHRDLSKDQNNDGKIDPWEWSKSCPCFDVRMWIVSVFAKRIIR